MGMSPERLKKWMAEFSKSVFDIASATKIHPNTVNRYLSGEVKHPHPSTLAAFERLITEEPTKRVAPKTA
jgi:transcriptional regulator with XRE-family HTH domain